jgi:hypothetical protein
MQTVELTGLALQKNEQKRRRVNRVSRDDGKPERRRKLRTNVVGTVVKRR